MRAKLLLLTLQAALLAPLALAGSADAPEISDPEGDCALAYGESYLDLTAAWIEAETDESFVVALTLAAFDPMTAEGAAYAVQFEHQGVRWGILAMYRPVSDSGWSFLTGQVDAERALSDTFQPTVGEWREGPPPTLRVTFPKSLFPHDDPNDFELRSFFAGTADLRPAYPFILATDPFVPGSSNGRWLVCDEATSDATYPFTSGAHSHGASSPTSPEPASDAEPPAAAASVEESASGPAPPDAPRAVPQPPLLVLLGVTACAMSLSRPPAMRRR